MWKSRDRVRGCSPSGGLTQRPGLARPHPERPSGAPSAQGWNGAVCVGVGEEQSPRGQAAVQVLGPHSQLEEGIQEVLTATQTSRSLVRSRTKAAAPRDEWAMAWPVGWPPGQEATALRTASAVTQGSPG